MDFFRNLSMKVKLLGSIGFVIVLSIIVASVAVSAIYTAIKVESQLEGIVARDMSRTIELSAEYNKVHKWLHELQVKPSPELVEQGLKSVSHFKAFSLEAKKNPATPFPNEISQIRDDCVQLADVIRDSGFEKELLAGRYTEADKIFLSDVLPYSSSVNAQFAQLFQMYNAEIQNRFHQLNLNSELYTIIIILAIGVLLAAFMGWAISSYITGHTAIIREKAQQIESGNFNLHIDNIPRDEIGDIYDAFIGIANTLNKTIARVIAVSSALKEYSHELNTASWSISDGAKAAESNSLTVAAAADEMVSTTSDIAKNCHTAQESSEGTRYDTNEGVEKVRTTVARIKEQSIQTRDDAEKVLRLAEQSQKIGSIVGTIDEIAAQTNLLALNAAIEAARAGEAGRGFAVVADEVRALASRTSKSTQEITAMVKSVQEDSQAATDSMNASVDQMEEMAERAGELEATLNNIMNSVNNVNSQIIQIATAAEEQTTATSEISSNMQNITEMAQQSVDVAQNCVKISDYAVHLITQIMKELDFFTLDEHNLDKKELTIPGANDAIVPDMEDVKDTVNNNEEASHEKLDLSAPRDESYSPMPQK